MGSINDLIVGVNWNSLNVRVSFISDSKSWWRFKKYTIEVGLSREGQVVGDSDKDSGEIKVYK